MQVQIIFSGMTLNYTLYNNFYRSR